MPAGKKLITDGINDTVTWYVIGGAVLLGIFAQAFKAAGIHPPLTIREIIVRSGGAGIAALTLGLILLGLGKLELHWALYMGLGGVIGYWGQEALAWAVTQVQHRAGTVVDQEKGA